MSRLTMCGPNLLRTYLVQSCSEQHVTDYNYTQSLYEASKFYMCVYVCTCVFLCLAIILHAEPFGKHCETKCSMQARYT